MTTRRYLATLAIVLLLLVGGVALLYAIRAMTPPTALSTPTSTPIPAPTATAAVATPTAPTSAPTATPQAGGSITGRFGYPSDFIPPVTVYAISAADARAWYSVAFAGFGNPPRPTLPPGVSQATYTISGVAPGTYWVVAYRNDGQLPDPGFYSRAVECYHATPSGPCPDITLASATVTAGQTTTGIDVITWGVPPGQPSPTIPPRPTPR